MTDPADPSDHHPLLLTPGPLTTSTATRQAMLRDWGSRDGDFIALTARVRARLEDICNARPSHTCVPIQGSGTFAVEAMIGTLVPPAGTLLVASNGAYGRRIAQIAERLGRAFHLIESAEDKPTPLDALAAALRERPDTTHLAAVHCETTSGVLNPISDVCALAEEHGVALLIDAMSSFGALPLDCQTQRCQAIAASSNKCLEGAPGLGFVIAEIHALSNASGDAPSLSLDLAAQWHGLDTNGQWRFTPPTHIVAALGAALEQFDGEGGQPGRLARYRANCTTLVTGMRALGFEAYLDDRDQAPIIVTFRTPEDPRFSFEQFYDRLHDRGIVIYPGKITAAPTFRIGCIGAITSTDIRRALAEIEAVLHTMGFRAGAAT